MVDFKEKLAVRLKIDEGEKFKPYKCSENKLTIGVGHNLEAKGISQAVSDLMLDEDMNDAITGATNIVNGFDTMPDNVKLVLASMVFQMGELGVSKFVNMLRAVEVGDYHTASIEMLDSLWAKQTPNRANNLATIMKG